MSKMLKALRQLEATQRLAAAQPATEEFATVDEADLDCPKPSPTAPLEPSPERAPPKDEPFEPGFTAWNELSEPYDTVDGLTFDGFLEEADAKRKAGSALPPIESVAESVTESSEPAPIDEAPQESTAETSAQVEDSTLSTHDAGDVETNLFSTLETAEQLTSVAVQVDDLPEEAPLPSIAHEEASLEPQSQDELREQSADAHGGVELNSTIVDELTPIESAAEATLPEQSLPRDTSVDAEENSTTENEDELNWDDLFPNSDVGLEGRTDGDSDLATTDALGGIDIDELVVDTPADLDADLGDAILGAPGGDAPSVQSDEQHLLSPCLSAEGEAESANALDTASDEETLGEEPIVGDSNPNESSNTSAEQPTNDTDKTEDHPAFSPAEVAASADLQDDVLLKQYRGLVNRIDKDFGKSEHRCAALVGAEHQPHVTDTMLRTAMAACLDEDRHVLLIDASLGDKHLTAGLGMSAEFGLAEVIKGRVPWQQAVRATGTPGMCVLPSGRIAPPVLSTSDERLNDLLKELTCQWDMVLLDAGCCHDSPAAGFMAAARNVYLLVRLGETEVDAAKKAIDTIAASGAKHRGAVATNA